MEESTKTNRGLHPDTVPSPPQDCEFRSVVAPTTVRPTQWTQIAPAHIIKDAFRLHTLLAIGAGLQLAVSAAVPMPYCVIPAAALLVLAAAATLVQILLPTWHGMRAGVLPGRTTAHMPTAHGRYAPTAPPQGVVVFHFGARFNHPLGVLAPGAQAMTRHFRATLAALERERTAYGLLGGDLFRGGAAARTSHDTLFLVLYFRDVQGLQRFAASAVHREALAWLTGRTTTVTAKVAGDGSRGSRGSSSGRYAHLSAFHETFVVPPGHYESLYINTAPILLGNTHTEKAGEAGEAGDGEDSQGADKVWLSSLVDADDERLRSMTARLKRSL
ncbi:hypothetical protein SPBR_03972 [Sporothrix brasiliensis 5110]|uniref:Uncharacterized protein n=1 Tax=Sporothrix brasiliensis 5110 TaxID=1398154 RepID=A0A0C2J1U6_9PEZI|nr:uncharacterized protein SPBR_03972 [Sporothrix brasiliensis 5110]KIH95286.1 hypothetical protein SPBR_03972 [Sporothrix brasiliensis 5110]